MPYLGPGPHRDAQRFRPIVHEGIASPLGWSAGLDLSDMQPRCPRHVIEQFEYVGLGAAHHRFGAVSDPDLKSRERRLALDRPTDTTTDSATSALVWPRYTYGARSPATRSASSATRSNTLGTRSTRRS